MGKLHELLAAEKDRDDAWNKILKETITLFSKQADRLWGHKKHLEMRDEDRKFEEDAAYEDKPLITTVPDKLKYASGFAVRYFDLIFQKEQTNQSAEGAIIIDGHVILEGLPVTFILGMERRLVKLRAMYEAIPTLSPSHEWVRASDVGKNIFRIKTPEVTSKTESIPKSEVLYDATENHPAQIEKWHENVVIGKFIKHVFSGMISPKRKSELLGRIDELIIAFKEARQRANEEEVEPKEVGQVIMDYIHEHWKEELDE